MQSPREHICERADAKVRLFLYDVAEGVANYRSLHSLTQQVEHQYHGRFLIELVQNAHDALSEVRTSGHASRIAIVLDDSDSQYGTLLVANDGHPFTESDFDSLSQLGQSNKDPQKSIGNKGIGFRSVLEISDCPEVFSKARSSSESFDGYCFGFNPNVVASLRGPVETLALSDTIPPSPISGMPLVDWGEQTTNKFRHLVHSKSLSWLRREFDYLSPYLLPVPISADHSTQVGVLQEQGFSTVVRLPLKSADARATVARHMGQIPSSVLLFLDRVDRLELRNPGQRDRLLTRTIKEQRKGDHSYSRVRLSDEVNGDRDYSLWIRTLRVAEATPDLRSAISKLPGRWPEIAEIPVSVAVRIGDEPEQGFFSIYLPTDVPTGSAVNINAPFYGNMSRTEIQFEDGYNKYLLQATVELVADVIFTQLSGKGFQEARSIVDMISPIGRDVAARTRWCDLLNAATGESPTGRIDTEQIVLADAGWRALNATSILPDTSGNTLITADVLRRHATFDIFHECLSSRRRQLIDLASSRYEVGADPTIDSLAETIERVANEVLERAGDWDAFWRDVMHLLPGGQSALAGYKVLAGTDGKLHSGTETQYVFFPPRQGTDDAAMGNNAILEIPASLQSYVAFLSDQITLYSPRQKNEQLPIRDYLSRGLVAPFRIESILGTVIKGAIPPLPTALTGKYAKRCCDVMTWSLQLMRSVVIRGRGADDLFTQLQRVPVPCRGGWFPMAVASFGQGWPESVGATLVAYLDERGDHASRERMKRVLVPPDHAAWGGMGTDVQDLLLKGGVFDGIRLIQIESDAWSSGFQASRAHAELPDACPGIDPELWSNYVTEVAHQLKVPLATPQQYKVGPVYTFPGMESLDTSSNSRANLSALILKSMPYWPKDWGEQSIDKILFHSRQQICSVLRYFLVTRPWLALASEGSAIKFAVPELCWHVPSNMIYRRATHFAHLHALPYDLAKDVDADARLAVALRGLGMPYFDTESPTSEPRLINALTSAIGAADAPGENVLLGQIRDAWGAFQPADSSARPLSLPVQDASNQLVAVEPTATNPLYLPDLGTLTLDLQRYGKSVIAISPDDAKRLKDWFVGTYGDAITPTSQLTLVPLVSGNAWHGDNAIPLRDDDLAWLASPILTLVAFHGQRRGLYSKAFEERQSLLRELTVDWVSNLDISVERGTDRLLTRSVPAYWDSRNKTLLVHEECKHTPAQVAPALAQALDRNDLELPLRLILDKVKAICEPPDDLTAVLATLGISEQQVASVRDHLQGDMGQIARLMHVLCAVLAIDTDVYEVLTAQSEDQLAQVIARFGIEGLSIPFAIETARDSQDLYEFGTRISKALGQRGQLPRWNDALVRLGRKPLENSDWQPELESTLNEARGLIVRALVSLAKRRDSVTPIAAAMSQYDQLPPEDLDLSEEYWVIGFQEAMTVVADWLNAVTGADELTGQVRGATSIEDLRSRLDSIGIDVNTDPDERLRANQEFVASVLERTESIREAWWDKTDAASKYGIWANAQSTCAAALKDSFGDELFTTQLDEAAVLARLSVQQPYSEFDTLHQALVAASSVHTFQGLLRITDEDISGVRARIDAKRAEDRRLKNTVAICGGEFDASEDNRMNLWKFINEHMDCAALAIAHPLNLGKSSKLSTVKAVPKRSHNKGAHKTNGAKIQRQSKAVDETIGLVGEIFVFQMLQREYGNDIVTAASWRSENSRNVFADNDTDDGMGCDFAFTSGKRAYRVEVKATAGEDESFRLGSSEIALAMKLASGRAARNTRYVIVHVKNALSPAPELVVLPNPYAAKSSKLFTVEEADTRVRYKLRS